MSEQDYRATLVRIGQLARDWQDCRCEGGCNACIDRVCAIEELTADARGIDAETEMRAVRMLRTREE